MIHITTEKGLNELIKRKIVETPINERPGWQPRESALRYPMVLPVYAEYSNGQHSGSKEPRIFVYEPQVFVPESLVFPNNEMKEEVMGIRNPTGGFEDCRWRILEQICMSSFHTYSQRFDLFISTEQKPSIETVTTFDFKHPKDSSSKYLELMLPQVDDWIRSHDYGDYKFINILPPNKHFLQSTLTALDNLGYIIGGRK